MACPVGETMVASTATTSPSRSIQPAATTSWSMVSMGVARLLLVSFRTSLESCTVVRWKAHSQDMIINYLAVPASVIGMGATAGRWDREHHH